MTRAIGKTGVSDLLWSFLMRARARRGFTLLEIAIVVVLMGIIGGYAAPRLVKARMSASSRSAAQAVLSQIARTRDIASRRRIAARVVLTSSEVRSFGTVAGVEQQLLPPLSLTGEYGASLTSAKSEIRFDTRGFASGLTGHVEVRTYHGEQSTAICISRYGNARLGGCLS
jgi:prepilin-type N-terminal cleavage/methylation domain-containing protein